MNQIMPVWTLPDRMNKAMTTAGLSVTEMAELLGVHRNTIGGYIHGRIQPDEEMLKKWAVHTGVFYDWLVYGSESAGAALAVIEEMREALDAIVDRLASDRPAQLRRTFGISKRKRKRRPS
jgi:transcriptional regulator with XRE-family HTH domain